MQDKQFNVKYSIYKACVVRRRRIAQASKRAGSVGNYEKIRDQKLRRIRDMKSGLNDDDS